MAAHDVENTMTEEDMTDMKREIITAAGHTDGRHHHITVEDTDLVPDHVHIRLAVIEDKDLKWMIEAAVGHLEIVEAGFLFYSVANR